MWVKICGITQPDGLPQLAALAPDAIGLNFYARSRRCVTPEAARQIVERLPDSIRPVGVFVNHSLDEINHICRYTGLTTVQLHGDETADFASKLPQYDLIRAFRVGTGGLAPVAAELQRYQALGIPLLGCLIDAAVAGEYGGTGHQAPWELLARHWQADWPALFLAGGLQAGNVAQAVAATHPAGVDVASGVEALPGIQDLDKVARFIAAARAAGPGPATPPVAVPVRVPTSVRRAEQPERT
jgi:phosphoribosylanthranilate isomerase